MTQPRASRDWFGWSARSDPERFDTYTRWSLYTVLGLEPLLAFSVAAGSSAMRAGAATGYVLLSFVHLATTVRVASAGMTAIHGDAPVPRGRWASLAVVTALVVGAAIWAFGIGERADLAYALMVPLLAALGATATSVAGRLLVLMVAATAVVTGALLAAGGASGRATVAGVVAVVFAGAGIALSMRASVWMLGVVWEQEQRREVDARLAVAEERLRFSRDLHDVFGRTLSTVAVKSELAAELARRGDERGVAQMLEVRELAQSALKEVRAVVDGYRGADLPTELLGARDILRSAGVRTRVVGDGLGLPPGAQEALAWVVREAVTNVVRHSAASECSIEVSVAPDGCVVEIVNDGAVRETRSRPGAGLSGLRERLSGVGGELTTVRDGQTFTLRARVPLPLQGVGGSGRGPEDMSEPAPPVREPGARGPAERPRDGVGER